MHFKWSCNILCDKQDCKIVVNYFSQYCMRAGRAHLGCQWWSLSSADTFHQCFKQIISVNISFIWWILDEKRHSYDPAPQPPNNFKKAEQGDLAKAHQVSCQCFFCFYSILVAKSTLPNFEFTECDCWDAEQPGAGPGRWGGQSDLGGRQEDVNGLGAGYGPHFYHDWQSRDQSSR